MSKRITLAIVQRRADKVGIKSHVIKTPRGYTLQLEASDGHCVFSVSISDGRVSDDDFEKALDACIVNKALEKH